MRLAPFALLFAIHPASAEEPTDSSTCVALADAEHAVFESEVALGRAKAMVFGDLYQRRIATADADEREVLVDEQEEARRSLSELRKELKNHRLERREVRKGIRTMEVVCEDRSDASDVS